MPFARQSGYLLSLRHIWKKYKDHTGQRVFNFYKLYASVDSFTAAINKGLKKIGDDLGIDDLEFYAARHTWARCV